MKAERTGAVVLTMSHADAGRLFAEFERYLRQLSSLGEWCAPDHPVLLAHNALAEALGTAKAQPR